jgi:hypothetical protein
MTTERGARVRAVQAATAAAALLTVPTPAARAANATDPPQLGASALRSGAKSGASA